MYHYKYSMYKIVFKNQTDYDVIETATFQKTDMIIKGKLFNNDMFDENEKVIHSPTRLDKYIPGVLDLSRTYGKDGKFLYLCKPDDKRLPFFMIPYQIPVTFFKNVKHLYITFEFIHWEQDQPRGSMTQNLGCVNEPEHFYEYMLYCKSLNVSIQSFTKDANREIKQHDGIIDSIIHMYSIPLRKANVFTIDSPGSIDLDDAISFCNNVVSVYITHVPIIMEYLNLWDSFTNRISTIYLPDKKRSMLPNILSQLCSLNEGQRICLVMDYDLITLEHTYSVCAVKVKKNYVYTDEIVDKDYQELSSRLSVKKPNELITKLMILFNTNSAECMKQYKNGIYKKVVHDYDFMKNQATGYELYSDEVNYMHITSPIRRLIDILNMTQLTLNLGLFPLKHAEVFYKKWVHQLDYMNLCFKNIKKVQNQCNLLSIFETQKHQVFKGYVYDKIARSDNKFKYQVHIYDLNINYDLTILDDLDSKDYTFKLYVFHDESTLKKKVKLQLIFTNH